MAKTSKIKVDRDDARLFRHWARQCLDAASHAVGVMVREEALAFFKGLGYSRKSASRILGEFEAAELAG